MGRDPAEPAIPGLLSTDGVKAAVPSSPTVDAAKEATGAASQRHILPKNLCHAISQLSDGDLDELFEAAFDEAKRRGRLPQSVKTDVTPSALRPSELTTKRLPPTDKRRREDIVEVSLARGQINAIRAASKAGITPSRIARRGFPVECAKGVGERSVEVSTCSRGEGTAGHVVSEDHPSPLGNAEPAGQGRCVGNVLLCQAPNHWGCCVSATMPQANISTEIIQSSMQK